MNLKLGDVGSSEGLEGLGGNMRKMYCHKEKLKQKIFADLKLEVMTW